MSSLKRSAIIGWATVCIWTVGGVIEGISEGRDLYLIGSLLGLALAIACIGFAAAAKD